MKQSTSFLEEPDGVATTTVDAPAVVRVAVPSLVGVEPHVAVERLRDAGLVPSVEARAVADEDLVGVVCVQEPDSGSELEPDGVVVMTVGVPATVAKGDEASPEAELVDEDDDWFDIDLPGEHSDASQPVVFKEHGGSKASEHARPRRAGESLLRGGRGWRIAVLGVLALAAIVVFAMVSGSGAPRSEDASAPRTTRPERAPAPAVGPAPGTTPQRPVRSSPSARRPGAAARRGGRLRSRTSAQQPARPVTSSAPSYRSVPVQPTQCEFCFELAGR